MCCTCWGHLSRRPRRAALRFPCALPTKPLNPAPPNPTPPRAHLLGRPPAWAWPARAWPAQAAPSPRRLGGRQSGVGWGQGQQERVNALRVYCRSWPELGASRRIGTGPLGRPAPGQLRHQQQQAPPPTRARRHTRVQVLLDPARTPPLCGCQPAEWGEIEADREREQRERAPHSLTQHEDDRCHHGSSADVVPHGGVGCGRSVAGGGDASGAWVDNGAAGVQAAAKSNREAGVVVPFSHTATGPFELWGFQRPKQAVGLPAGHWAIHLSLPLCVLLVTGCQSTPCLTALNPVVRMDCGIIILVQPMAHCMGCSDAQNRPRGLSSTGRCNGTACQCYMLSAARAGAVATSGRTTSTWCTAHCCAACWCPHSSQIKAA